MSMYASYAESGQAGGSNWKAAFLLSVVAGYLLLGYGFMQVRVPPGTNGPPIGEFCLVVLLASLNPVLALGRIARVVIILPFLIWWGYGLSRAIMGFGEYGFWALRDATHVVESLYLLVGFVMAGNRANMRLMATWVPAILVAAAAYRFLMPVAEHLKPFSPIVYGGAGQPISILLSFSHDLGGIVLLIAALYLTLFDGHEARSKLLRSAFLRSLLALVFIGFAVMLLQSRTVYLQIAFMGLLLFVYRPGAIARWGRVTPLVVLMFALLMASGVTLVGRLGVETSWEFMLNHLLSTVGIAGEGVAEPASGVSLRVGWWTGIWKQLGASYGAMLFGMGYGMPLVDFGYAPIGAELTVTVREPHNSYISALARLGAVGALALLWMHVQMTIVLIKNIALCRRAGWKDLESYHLLALAWFAMVWILCFGEDGLEKPYIAIPYYLVWGAVLRFRYTVSVGGARTTPQPRSARARAFQS